MSPSPQVLSYTARTGLALFTLSILLLHFLSPEFDPVSKGISYYAHGKFSWLLTLSFFFVGVASATVTALLWRQCRTPAGLVGLFLLLSWTVLLEAGAFFPMDPAGAPPTLSGRIHSLAGTSFLLLPPAAFLITISLSRQRPADRYARPGWILAWSVLAASILLVLFNGFLVSFGLGGLVQRAYWLTIVFWLYFLSRVQRG